MPRVAQVERKSNETEISLSVNLDGSGQCNIRTGIGFFDHMVAIIAAHGGFDITGSCSGDLYVDGHHVVEDFGIVLGKAFGRALGDKSGIARFGSFILPMDEALALVSVDISGRPFLHCELPEMAPMVGSFDTELLEEFLRAFAVHAGIALHVKVFHGKNTHHIIEAVFKALARALGAAVSTDPRTGAVPSTKGIID